MSIEIEQDETGSGGGYAVLRFPRPAKAPGQRTMLRLQPLDDAHNAASWAKATFQAVETRLVGGTLELVVGPELVDDVPADIAVRVVVDSLGIDEVCLWPSLAPSVSAGRGRLPRVERSEVVEMLPRQPAPANEAASEDCPAAEPPGPERDEQGAGPPEPPGRPPSMPTGGATQLSEQPGVADDGPLPAQLPAPGPGTGSGRSMAACFAAGVIVGAALLFGWQAAFSAPPAQNLASGEPLAPSSDQVLLEALDTADFEADGERIFDTAAGEWVRRGDEERRAGRMQAAAENYRRALRAAWHEDGRELGDVVSRLAEALSADKSAGEAYNRSIRTLMALSAASGDPAGMCRLALLHESSVGGPPDQDLARRLRARADRISAGTGSPGLPPECR